MNVPQIDEHVVLPGDVIYWHGPINFMGYGPRWPDDHGGAAMVWASIQSWRDYNHSDETNEASIDRFLYNYMGWLAPKQSLLVLRVERDIVVKNTPLTIHGMPNVQQVVSVITCITSSKDGMTRTSYASHKPVVGPIAHVVASDLRLKDKRIATVIREGIEVKYT